MPWPRRGVPRIRAAGRRGPRMADVKPPDFGPPDHAALVWIVLAWLGHGRFIGRLFSPRGIAGRLRGVRRV